MKAASLYVEGEPALMMPEPLLQEISGVGQVYRCLAVTTVFDQYRHAKGSVCRQPSVHLSETGPPAASATNGAAVRVDGGVLTTVV
ncbi:hypothetical protein GD627_14820 [Arthrobacter yangruifuii]|uniref:Uncharacterized protein n=1 Tax=Arthrobacter yangruifuii TaxID=2606616 RepID=A0A5N6MDY6_9MICC|nr:hypothetical protein [Arthrobacter yangruifuii]KAD3455982.1 hypothetical protein GD627_14820 [Arthrobacter yangruifuii]